MKDKTIDDVLKKCPFCGSRAHLKEEKVKRGLGFITTFRIYCTNINLCWARTTNFYEKKNTIQAWNKRAEPTKQQILDIIEGKVEKLKKKLPHLKTTDYIDEWSVKVGKLEAHNNGLDQVKEVIRQER